jgi:hypothetical protein
MEESRDIRIHNTNFLISSSLILHIKIIFCLVLSKREWKTKKHWRFFFSFQILLTILFWLRICFISLSPLPPFWLITRKFVFFLSIHFLPPRPAPAPQFLNVVQIVCPLWLLQLLSLLKKQKQIRQEIISKSHLVRYNYINHLEWKTTKTHTKKEKDPTESFQIEKISAVKRKKKLKKQNQFNHSYHLERV